ncbi:LOW QUALITY PROTEIN: conserved hypothetical protein, partial [Streptomyces griseoflavus Tu4000]
RTPWRDCSRPGRRRPPGGTSTPGACGCAVSTSRHGTAGPPPGTPASPRRSASSPAPSTPRGPIPSTPCSRSASALWRPADWIWPWASPRRPPSSGSGPRAPGGCAAARSTGSAAGTRRWSATSVISRCCGTARRPWRSPAGSTRCGAGGSAWRRRPRVFPESGGPLRDLTARPTSVAVPEFTAFVQARMADPGPADPAVRRLLDLYGAYRRLVERSGMPDPLLGGSTPVGVGGLRGLVAGRTVCLVSNASEVAGSGLGAEIDGYDLVVRCDSFRLRADGTGERTGLHAVSLRGAAPWDGPAWTQPAGIRLVFGDPAAAWRRATRQRLAPGAQEHIGDASLRRPLSDPALLGEDCRDPGTSTAFTVLRLLDFLDVSPRLDLVGFDKPGRLRPEEAEWVMERATHVDDSKMRIALR